jgi:hypothetical protein
MKVNGLVRPIQFDACLDDPLRLSKCERNRLQDKITLYSALDRGFEIRLHFHSVTELHTERLHDHRFPFVSRILSGGYLHEAMALEPKDRIYLDGIDDFDGKKRLEFNLSPLFERQESQGSFYMMKDEVLHTTLSRPNSISLFVRGPAVKERRLIVDRGTNEIWWGRGQAVETESEKRTKVLNREVAIGLRDGAISSGVL